MILIFIFFKVFPLTNLLHTKILLTKNKAISMHQITYMLKNYMNHFFLLPASLLYHNIGKKRRKNTNNPLIISVAFYHIFQFFYLKILMKFAFP